jgi:hypothetical protein
MAQFIAANDTFSSTHRVSSVALPLPEPQTRKMSPVSEFYKTLELIKREFQRGRCLHPDAPTGCATGYSAAHSVQRALIARHLAEKNHVLRFVASADPKIHKCGFKSERVGINKATTFFGFCSRHDSDLFRPLETRSFEFERSQIALLGFRALSREVYMKQAEFDATSEIAKKMKADKNPLWLHLMERARLIGYGLLNVRQHWQLFGNMVKASVTSGLRYWAAEFDAPPEIFASTAAFPEWDCEGRRIQDLQRLRNLNPVAFSAIAAGPHALAVLCWHESGNAVYLPFIESLHRGPPERLANRIATMAFEMSENVIFRESWWKKLPRSEKNRILLRLPSGAGRERTSDAFVDDGGNAVNGHPVKVESDLRDC